MDLLSKTPVRNPHLQKGIDATKQLIHAYNSLEDEIIWAIINRHLSLLKKEITDLLRMV